MQHDTQNSNPIVKKLLRPNHALRKARERRAWTQQVLADHLGTIPLTIHRWEQGKCSPSSCFRTRLCDLFGLTAQELGLENPEILPSEAPMLALSSPHQSSSFLWTVPYPRNRFFTGRDVLLNKLHALLSCQQQRASAHTCALSGLGGIGKTQIALEYAYRHAQDYTAIFWIAAETSEALIASFRAIADVLELPQRKEQDQEQTLAAIMRWFNSHEDWLLILDNIEELKLAKRFWPSAQRGSLLLTTRAQVPGTLAQHMEIPPMTQEESISFLLHRAQRLSPQDTLEPMLPEEATAAQAIAETIDGLPLALDQIGAYIEASQCCLSDYLHLLQAHPIHLLQQRHADSSHPSSVVATFTLAFAKLQRVNPTAADLLAFCAFLAPDTIPEEVIMQGASLFGRDLQAQEDNPLRFNVLYRELLEHSLIRRNALLKTVIVHRLLQVVCRAYLAEEKQRWVQWAVQAINKLFPTAESAAWAQCERLLPHALAVLEHLDHLALSGQEPDVQVEAALLREKIAVYLADRAVLLQ